MERKSLSGWLRRDGHEIVAGGRGKRSTFTTAQICAAIYGDEDRARTRDHEASAKLKEQKYARLSGELVEWSEVERRVAAVLAPVRVTITSARATLPARVNPADPHLAREAIEQWEEQALSSLREEAVKAAMMQSEAEDTEAEDE